MYLKKIPIASKYFSHFKCILKQRTTTALIVCYPYNWSLFQALNVSLGTAVLFLNLWFAKYLF